MRLFFKHNALVVIAIVFPTVMLPAQGIYPLINNIINPLSFSRIGISEWASGGVRTVEVGSPAAAVNNPALLLAQTLSVYAEFAKRSETDYYVSSSIKYDGQYLLPNFVSVAASVEGINIGLGYTNLYDKFFTIGPIEVTTESQPDGTGEFIETTTREAVHAVTASVSYSHENIFSVGLSAGINVAVIRDEMYLSAAEGSGTGAIIIAGLYGRPIESIHIGGSLQLSSKIRSSAKLEAQDLRIRYDADSTGNNQRITASVFDEFPFTAEFPLTAQVGFKWDINEMVSVMAEADYTEWSSLSAYYDNVIDGHFGIVVKPFPSLKFRGGYFTQTYPANASVSIWMDQKFWTAGVEWNALPGISITGGTSQNFSSETGTMYFSPPDAPFRQNLYLLGLLYQL